MPDLFIVKGCTVLVWKYEGTRPLVKELFIIKIISGGIAGMTFRNLIGITFREQEENFIRDTICKKIGSYSLGEGGTKMSHQNTSRLGIICVIQSIPGWVIS